MKKNVLLSVLLVGLFGVIGCANNPEESKDSYFYYEVVNIWYELLFRGVREKIIEFSLERQGFQ